MPAGSVRTADGDGLAFGRAAGEGLAPFDRAAGFELGDGAAGVDADGATAGVELAVADVPGAEVAAGPTTSDDAAAGDSPARELDDAAGADAEGPAALVDAVHPAVTRAGTRSSAAAIRRIPPSSPTQSQILAKWGLV